MPYFLHVHHLAYQWNIVSCSWTSKYISQTLFIDTGQNEIDSDDMNILTNLINRLPIENSGHMKSINEDDKEINAV